MLGKLPVTLLNYFGAQEMARIPSNGIHKREPQYYHIKDIRVVMISAIVGTSFLAAISIDCFKIAQILFF